MKLAAVITETRRFPKLKEVIESHLDMLPPCDLIVFHADNWRSFVGLPVRSRYAVRVNTLVEYNTLMTSLAYWTKLLKYDRVLIFQNDSRILRKGIQEFYEWDYIGAPWKFQLHGGNGGLSLRNPKVMMKTLMTHQYSHREYEDVFYSNNLEGKLAPREECARFSCETIYALGTWGYHAIENWLHPNQCSEIINQYKRGRIKEKNQEPIRKTGN